MFEMNGVMYASEMPPSLKVEEARVTQPHMMLVTFSTGETRLFDMRPLLGLPAFAPLADEGAFADFAIERGVLTWRDGSIDIAPEAVFDRSFEYLASA